MKKLCLVAILALFGLNVSAQSNNDNAGLYAGINAGLPIGDYSDTSSFALAVDLGYLFELDDDINVGVESGYARYFGKDNWSDLGFMPIAGVLEYSICEEFDIEGGAGYAVSLETGGGGDFYWRLGGTYDLSDNDEVVMSFRSRSGNGYSANAIFLGYRRNF